MDAQSLPGDPSEHQITCSAAFGYCCKDVEQTPDAAIKVSAAILLKTLAEELLPGPFPGQGGSRSGVENIWIDGKCALLVLPQYCFAQPKINWKRKLDIASIWGKFINSAAKQSQ